jgi:hypothetical protein
MTPGTGAPGRCGNGIGGGGFPMLALEPASSDGSGRPFISDAVAMNARCPRGSVLRRDPRASLPDPLHRPGFAALRVSFAPIRVPSHPCKSVFIRGSKKQNHGFHGSTRIWKKRISLSPSLPLSLCPSVPLSLSPFDFAALRFSLAEATFPSNRGELRLQRPDRPVRRRDLLFVPLLFVGLQLLLEGGDL